MTFLDRLFGNDGFRDGGSRQPGGERAALRSPDERAIERYRYVMQTAPLEIVERAHEQAFEQMSAEQRRYVYEQLIQGTPPLERSAAQAVSAQDAAALARLATRTELRQPGFLERTLGSAPTGQLLGSFALAFSGSEAAQRYFSLPGDSGVMQASSRLDEEEDTDVGGGFDGSEDDR